MWWTARAMVRTAAKLGEWQVDGFDGFMTMQVHDEIVFDFPKRGNPVADAEKKKAGAKGTLFRTSNLWRIQALAKLMEQGGVDIGVPTPCSMEYHADNWSTGVAL